VSVACPLDGKRRALAQTFCPGRQRNELEIEREQLEGDLPRVDARISEQVHGQRRRNRRTAPAGPVGDRSTMVEVISWFVIAPHRRQRVAVDSSSRSRDS
jgi:hypothetical protein